MQRKRPLTVGEIFQASLTMYRTRFRTLMGASFLILFPYLIISTYIQTHFFPTSTIDMQAMLTKTSHAKTTLDLMQALPSGMVVWFCVLVGIYLVIVVPLLYGVVMHIVIDRVSSDGSASLSEAGNRMFQRLMPTVGTIILSIILYVLAAFVYVLLLTLLVALLNAVSGALASFVSVIGSIVMFFGVLVVVMRGLFIPAVVIVEGQSYLSAIRRTMQLTRRRMARLVPFCLLLFIVCLIVQWILSLFGSILFQSAGGQLLVTAIVGLLVTPFALVSICMMFLDLKAQGNK